MYWVAGIGPKLGLPAESKSYCVFILVFLGLCLDGAALYAFRKYSTTINPLKSGLATALVVVGVYRLTRNPMYVGLLFFLVAWFVHLNHILPIGFVVLFIVYLTKFQIIPEEKELEVLFGVKYQKYKACSRRWL